jgi:2-polyprenyl-6-hydroxyphenyl methylase/3-demethylubiquinone-9 3-methyltransferase
MLNSIKYHDTLAVGWEDRYRQGSFARRARFFETEILPLLPSGGRWLDAGCGSGTFSRMLARDTRSVVGVDASAQMLTEAARRAAAPDRLAFQAVQTIEQLPFVDESFDGAICLSVLEYLDHPDDGLAELARTLKLEGVLVVSVPHRQSLVRALQKIYRGLRLRPRQDREGVGYLSLSRFSTVPEKMVEHIERHGMTMRAELCFDPFLPRSVHPIATPSLIYMVCEKTRRAAAKP